MKIFYRNIHKNTITSARSKQEKQAKYNLFLIKMVFCFPFFYEAAFPLYMLYKE